MNTEKIMLRTKFFEPINCKTCTKQFRPKSSTQKCCSGECNKIHSDALKKMKILKHFYKPAKDLKKISKLLKVKKYTITDARTVNYIDSPTGKAYTGVAKRPFREVTSGFGFRGVLLQTDNRMFIQCHECGKWVRQITKAHLAEHKLDKTQYKAKFGLMKSTALVSDQLSYSLEERARIRLVKNPNSTKHLDQARAVSIAKMSHGKIVHNDEHNNRYAICEKQLGFRMVEYLKKYKILPSRSTKGEGGNVCKALYRRYGSLNNGFNHYGLPSLYRQGSAVELLAQDGKQYFFNYNKQWNRDDVYSWMVEHSPVLQGNVNKFADKDELK